MAETGEILFLSHRIPFPPDRGDKIRSHHVLKALSKIAPVHVATFYDDADDASYEADLAAWSASHCLLERCKALPVAALQALAQSRALSLSAFYHKAMVAYVRDVLARRPIAAIYIFSGQMAQYVPSDFTGRVVADLVDVDSAKFEAYAAKGHGPRSWMEQREARLLQREEARIAARADVTLLISQAEAALLQSRLPASLQSAGTTRIMAMGNGLDSRFFDRQGIAPEPRMVACLGPRLVFTGQMDYAPNIEAALRAMDGILPKVRRVFPDASLHIVGRNPVPELTARDGRDGVYVWGRVQDIRPWLVASDIALIPLDIARGVQNKVLEAMAMGLPVVLSSGAATGIGAMHERDFCVRDDDDAMAQAVITLAQSLEDEFAPQGTGQRASSAAQMGQNARQWIVAHASWQAALADLPAHLGFVHARLDDPMTASSVLHGG